MKRVQFKGGPRDGTTREMVEVPRVLAVEESVGGKGFYVLQDDGTTYQWDPDMQIGG